MIFFRFASAFVILSHSFFIEADASEIRQSDAVEARVNEQPATTQTSQRLHDPQEDFSRDTPPNGHPVTEPQPSTESSAIQESNGWQVSETDWQTKRWPLSASCPGAPIDNPISPGLLASELWADELLESTTTTARLRGDVRMMDGNRRMAAEELFQSQSENRFEASGQVWLETPELLFLADDVEGTLDKNHTQLSNARFRVFTNNANGSAESIRLEQQTHLYLNDAHFTTCPPEAEHWALDADEIHLDRAEGWGEADDVILRVAGVPILYLPYITFPIDDRRRSGFLPFSARHNDRNGFDLETPYYWNIAPNYDATFTPRYVEERGIQLGSEFRYLLDGHEGIAAIEVLPDDKTADDEFDEDGDPRPEIPPDRWSYSVLHHSRLSDHWSAGINASGVSDNQYFRELGTGLEISNRDRLLRSAYLRYSDETLRFASQATQYQVLNTPTEPYRELPQTTLFYQPLTEPNSLRFQFASELTRFDTPSTDTTRITGERLDLEPALSWPLESLAGFFEPRLALKHTRYQLDNPVTEQSDELERTIPIFSVDGGLFFERDLLIGEDPYLQTLEPRLFYVYIPEEDQQQIPLFDTGLPEFSFTQLFQENRFTGPDRVGDDNRISAALTSRLLNQANGSERFRISVGRAYYLSDRQVTLASSIPPSTEPNSSWLVDVEYRPFSHLRLKGYLEWDPKEDRTLRGTASSLWEPRPNHVINVAHRYRHRTGQVAEQMDIAFAWPLADDWRMVGRWNKDLVKHRVLETFAGLEYESCCWAVRMVHRRYLNITLDSNGFAIGDEDDYNSGVFVQFVFKGLGGAGQGGISELLEDGILGYRDTLGRVE